jgi:hypothetical protein
MPGRPPDLSPLPDHPAVIGGPYLGRYIGMSKTLALVRCPRCKATRERPASEIRREAQRANFKGYCAKCSKAAIREGSHRLIQKRRGHSAHNNGYRLTLLHEVSDADLPMYRAMQRSGQPVMEHRWVMAKQLGRPLASHECVDHMNGDKRDNRPENLRIYLKGRQQAGSANGYGTYYDEWQRAEARVRELEKALADRHC